MDTIGILNSYNIPGLPGRKTGRIRSFLDGLAQAGLEEGRDFQVHLVDTDELSTVAEETRRMVEAGVSLIHAVGTINAVAAARATCSVPVVYYGAHPQGRGDDECAAANVTGLALVLPLTQTASSFQIVRELVPSAKAVCSPFLHGTVFLSDRMEAIHREAHAERGPGAWVSSRHSPVGFDSLASVAAGVGLEYRELVYADLAELAVAIEGLDPGEAILMPFNESFFKAGAPSLLLNTSLQAQNSADLEQQCLSRRPGRSRGHRGRFRRAPGSAAVRSPRPFSGVESRRISPAPGLPTSSPGSTSIPPICSVWRRHTAFCGRSIATSAAATRFTSSRLNGWSSIARKPIPLPRRSAPGLPRSSGLIRPTSIWTRGWMTSTGSTRWSHSA